MTRELLFCLILQLSFMIHNVESNSDDVMKVYEDGDLEWLQTEDMAVPTGMKNEVLQTAPNGPPNKTKIEIEISAAKIIDFDIEMHQFTLKMHFKINWSEKRLKLVNSSLDGTGRIKMKSSIAWSPEIDVQSEVVSESMEEKLMYVEVDPQSAVSKWNWNNPTKVHYLIQSSSAMMTFSLKTKVKCSMDFRSHICRLEVSSLNVESIVFT